MTDDGRSLREGLQHHGREYFVPHRGNNDCDGVSDQPLQFRVGDRAEEPDVCRSGREIPKHWRVVPVPGDEKVRRGVRAELLDHDMSSLVALETADEEKVRPSMWRRFVSLGWRGDW